MTGLPSSYKTDGRHHREADGHHQPPGDVTIGEGKCRAMNAGISQIHHRTLASSSHIQASNSRSRSRPRSQKSTESSVPGGEPITGARWRQCRLTS